MSELSKLADVVYGRFLMLDVMAKAVPGGILFGGWMAILKGPGRTWQLIKDATFPVWVIVFCASWVAGLAVQGVAELVRIRSRTEPGLGALFASKVKDDRSQRFWRLVTIKEASGHVLVSLGLLFASGLLVLLAGLIPWSVKPESVALLVIAHLLGYGLFRTHRDGRKRQADYARQCLLADGVDVDAELGKLTAEARSGRLRCPDDAAGKAPKKSKKKG